MVPFAFGGTGVLQESSCESCRKITSRFEGFCARTMLGPYRVRSDAPTRRRSQRPTELSLGLVDKDGTKREVDVPADEHPGTLMLPVFAQPRRLTTSTDERRETFIMWFALPDIDVFELPKLHSAEAMRLGSFEILNFCQLLAKIAHSGAYYLVPGWTETWEPLLVELILGETNEYDNLIGGNDQVANEAEDAGFPLFFESVKVDKEQYLVAEFRLFAWNNTPVYRVVVGKNRQLSQSQVAVQSLMESETSAPPEQVLVREALALEAVNANEAEDLYRNGVERFPDSPQVLGAFANFLVQHRKDETAAEAMYTRALAADPCNATALGNYANLLRIQGHRDSAEEKYRAAIAADRQHAINLCNYSTFLWQVRGDHNAADGMFEKALQARPQRSETRELYSSFLSNWAVELWDTGNIDGAEQCFQRSLEVDAGNALPLGNYANFLWIVRKNFDTAQEMYEEAIQADPHGAGHHLTNRAGFLLACRSRDGGLQALAEAREALLGEDETLHSAQNLECAFYAFAHGQRAAAPEALREVRGFLDRGFRSPGADLLPNIEKAEADDCRERSWLLKLAAVINDDDAPDVLDKWPLWANLENPEQQ